MGTAQQRGLSDQGDRTDNLHKVHKIPTLAVRIRYTTPTPIQTTKPLPPTTACSTLTFANNVVYYTVVKKRSAPILHIKNTLQFCAATRILCTTFSAVKKGERASLLYIKQDDDNNRRRR